jgi:ubiquinone/menaquinone biosynthesis C-methylase UbiE
MDELPASRIYFKKAARSYDRVRAKTIVTEWDDKAIINFLDHVSENSKILDLPCGTGRCIPLLPNKNIGYTGVDISSDMLNLSKAKAQGKSNTHFVLSDARSLPFQNEQFDHAICFKFLKWLPNDEIVLQVLKELRRVTKVSILVNVKVNPQNLKFDLKELKDVLRKCIDRLRLGTYARRLDQSAFESYCEKAGFRISSKELNIASNGFVYNYVLECV